MARCPKCRHTFRTLEDEEGMHDCPNCGYHPSMEPKPRVCAALGCPETFVPRDSDAEDNDTYCSAECEENDNDGERGDCNGCGNTWNRRESDAKDPDSYCSSECEDDDTVKEADDEL